MNKYIIVAVVLIVAGILGLVYDQFSYTKDSQSANLGPLELTVREKQTVNIPTWIGGSSIVVGAGILFFALIKR